MVRTAIRFLAIGAITFSWVTMKAPPVTANVANCLCHMGDGVCEIIGGAGGSECHTAICAPGPIEELDGVCRTS